MATVTPQGLKMDPLAGGLEWGISGLNQGIHYGIESHQKPGGEWVGIYHLTIGGQTVKLNRTGVEELIQLLGSLLPHGDAFAERARQQNEEWLAWMAEQGLTPA